MPGTTSPDNIVYPLPGDPIAPLNTVFQDMADSVQDALDDIDLEKLTDVDLTSPVAGELLQYDGADWVNVDVDTALGAGKILQVVSVTKTDTFSTSSTSMTNITGLSATITPSATTSKVLAILQIGCIDVSAPLPIIGGDVTRDGTAIGIGDSAGSRTRAGWMAVIEAADRGKVVSWAWLDSPASTSALTYQARIKTASQTVYVNRLHTDTDNASFNRTVSSLTLLEVAG